MNFQQIGAKAEAECRYLNDKDCIKIYIALSAANTSSMDIHDSFKAEINKHHLKTEIIITGSFGYYDFEPLVTIEKSDRPTIMYHNITPETASELVKDYLMEDNPRPELAFCKVGEDEITGIPDISELPLFKLQNRISLRNCGFIDPENINHYVMRGKGFRGLSRALDCGQINVIEELRKSNLRSRCSGGYFTANKWQACADTEASQKHVICNAVDADPKALTARLLLEGDPYSVLEGLLIGAYTIGASHGYICINTGYSAAKDRVNKAFEQMRNYSLLGKNILDSEFSCDIEIKEVEPLLVSSEDTALLCTLEGRQMMPYLCVTSEKGLNGKPTLIDNAETMSNVSTIFQNSPELISAVGTEGSSGTKIVTLCGETVHKNTIEVPFGTTLRTLVEEIGGGVPGDKKIKAVQFGGPAGAFFSGDSLDIPISYETLQEYDSILGSGTIDVYDGDSCAVAMARDVMSYLQTQSCGKCVFCREGIYQMLDILKDVSDNKGKVEDLALLNELGKAMKTGSICGLGTAAPSPVLSSIKLFHNDYDAHIKEKKCPVNNKHLT